MLARDCEKQSAKQYERLVKKYVKMVRKDIYKEIKRAVKSGAQVTTYVFNSIYYDVDNNMAYRIREIVLPELLHQGFYVRKNFHLLPNKEDPEIYRIAWGNEIIRQKHIDDLNKEWRLKSQKEYK